MGDIRLHRPIFTYATASIIDANLYRDKNFILMQPSHLPSLKTDYRSGALVPPRIFVLRVNDREQPTSLLAHVIVEAVEVRDDDRGRSSLTLHHELILPKYSNAVRHGEAFTASYSSAGNVVCLTSAVAERGAVFMDLPDLKGQRIGTYLMDRLVGWAGQWPDAEVLPIKLQTSDASSANKERRNRFYEQFGIAFDYDDPSTRQSGVSKPMKVSALNRQDAWTKNIDFLELHEYLGDVLHRGQECASDLLARERVVRELVEEHTARERRPLRWAVGQAFRNF